MAKKDVVSKADYNSADIDKPITEDPKALEKQKKSILGKSAGPTSEERGSFVKYERLKEQIGQPFDTELIPFSKLRQMRNHAMIAFGSYYKKAPIIRASWEIDARDKNGPNAQVAAFVDAAFRPMYSSFINQYLTSHDFGFSAMEKQFKFEDPGAYYIDPKDPTKEKPAWTDSKIPPIIFKEFVSIPPEKASPGWNKKTGEFEGIYFESESTRGKKKNNGNKPQIDIYHALWATNEKAKCFGSLWGYPAIGYAFKYWWAYEFAWLHTVRAFERMAIPPIKIKYPQGDFKDSDGNIVQNIDAAILAGAKIRSNGVIVLPSTTNTMGLDKISNTAQWDAEYMTGGQTTFQQDFFKYMDTMMLRSLYVPEQALIEGSVGGSRNVAGEMNSSFAQSQYNIKAEIDLFINKYILPQLVARNFPDFVANGGTAKIVTTGFDSSDTAFTKEIIQLIGQSNPERLNIVDLRKAIDKAGIPIKSVTDLTIETETGTLDGQVRPKDPTEGQLGIVSTPGTATGFSYVEPREVIRVDLSEDINLAEDDYFNEKTPDVPYFDADAKKYLKSAFAKLKKRYTKQYASAAKYVSTQPDLPINDLVAGKAASRASEVVSEWAASQSESDSAFLKTVAGIVAVYILFHKGKDKTLTKSELDKLTKDYTNTLRDQIDATTKEELESFISKELKDNKSFDQISADLKDHFSDFPTFKSMRVIRTESRGIYNDAIIDQAEADGKKLLIHDALLGETDEECEIRDGKVVTPEEARTIKPKLHPNCTFYLEPITVSNFSVEEVDREFTDNSDGFYNEEEAILWVDAELTDEAKAQVVKMAVAKINNG